jgi:hypothetical protein
MNIYVGMKRNNIIYLTIVRYNEADIIPCSSEEPKEEREREALRIYIHEFPSSNQNISVIPIKIVFMNSPHKMSTSSLLKRIARHIALIRPFLLSGHSSYQAIPLIRPLLLSGQILDALR